MQCVFAAQAHGSGELLRTLWLHVVCFSSGLGKDLLLFTRCYVITGYSQPRKRQDSTNGSGEAVPCVSGNSGYELYWLAMVSSRTLSVTDQAICQGTCSTSWLFICSTSDLMLTVIAFELCHSWAGNSDPHCHLGFIWMWICHHWKTPFLSEPYWKYLDSVTDAKYSLFRTIQHHWWCVGKLKKFLMIYFIYKILYTAGITMWKEIKSIDN